MPLYILLPSFYSAEKLSVCSGFKERMMESWSDFKKGFGSWFIVTGKKLKLNLHLFYFLRPSHPGLVRSVLNRCLYKAHLYPPTVLLGDTFYFHSWYMCCLKNDPNKLFILFTHKIKQVEQGKALAWNPRNWKSTILTQMDQWSESANSTSHVPECFLPIDHWWNTFSWEGQLRWQSVANWLQ